MSRGIEAGRAYVRLGNVIVSLDDGIPKEEPILRNIALTSGRVGTALLGAGGEIAAPLLAAVGQFAKLGDQVHKMSLRTGIGAKELSAYNHALQLSGSSIESFERGIRNMQKSIFDAGQGLKTPQIALDELGLSVKDFQGLAPEKQFELIADRIAKIEDPSKQAALAFKLFGKSGTDLLPLIKSGAEGLAAMKQEAEELGVTMSEEDAQAAADFEDAMTRLKNSLVGAGASIAKAILPALLDFIDYATESMKTIAQWVGEHRGFTAALLAVGAAVTVLGGTLVGLSVIASAASVALGVLGTIAGLLASPFILGAALGVALGAAFLWATGAIDELGAGFTDTMEAMSRALEVGGIEAAWEAMWISMAAASADAVASILESLADLVDALTDNRVMKAMRWVSPLAAVQNVAGGMTSDALRGKASTFRASADITRAGRDSILSSLESQLPTPEEESAAARQAIRNISGSVDFAAAGGGAAPRVSPQDLGDDFESLAEEIRSASAQGLGEDGDLMLQAMEETADNTFELVRILRAGGVYT